MRHYGTLALSSSLVLLAGCSSTVASEGAGGSTGSTTSTSSSGSAGTGGDFDAGGAVTTYTTGMGPISLMPGEEETNCITIHLGNAAGGFVRRFRADLGVGSHHMIVYQSADTVEAPTPTPCVALSGILEGEHPVFIAQQATAELDFPSDENGVPVGFQIAANQMVKVEFHTINTTMAPLMVSGTAYMDTVPLSTKVTISDMAFWGTKKINIPMGPSTFDTGVLFQAAIPNTHSFAVTTHQHHLGTEMKVWYSTGLSDTSDLVDDGKDWSNPPLVMLNPALEFPAASSKGFAFECHWVQPTPAAPPVTFGESYYDEMCFLWHYYYPSQGFQVCIDGMCR
jgi:hypothetical protein